MRAFLFACTVCSTAFSHQTMSQEPYALDLNLATSTKQDIDFDTNAHTLGVRALTPYGLFVCDYSLENGETRIDNFDNVFGFTPIQDTTWHDYDATQLQCGVGVRMPLYQGELTASLGMMRYDGETDVPEDGKEITLGATRLYTKYERGDYMTYFQLLEKNYDYEYRHIIGDYDSDTSGTIRSFDLAGKWSKVYVEAQHLNGYKEKAFTTPLYPYADFNYTQNALSLGPLYTSDSGVLRYIALTYIEGSERGSFNKLDLDSGIRGAILGMEFDNAKLRLTYMDTSSSGTRDYTPVTDDLAEARSSRSVSLALNNEKWSVKLENNDSLHHGFVTSTGIYSAITGCTDISGECNYRNNRAENEWKLDWQYHYSDRIILKGDLYNRARKDQQYNEATHRYTESGGMIGVMVKL